MPTGVSTDDILDGPTSYFNFMMDFHCIDTEFGRRVVKELSRVVKVHNYASLEISTGEFISPVELSHGAKNILIMAFAEDSVVTNMLFCGDNCNKFVAEICKTKDLNLITTRLYNPWYRVEDTASLDSGVRIWNTGKIVYTQVEYVDYLMKVGLWDLL